MRNLLHYSEPMSCVIEQVLEQQLQVIDAQKRAITITSLTTPAFVDKTQQQVIVV